jgi:hypothetical protein
VVLSEHTALERNEREKGNLTNKTFIDNFSGKSESFENLSPLVGRQRRNPHLTHYLLYAILASSLVGIDNLLFGEIRLE